MSLVYYFFLEHGVHIHTVVLQLQMVINLLQFLHKVVNQLGSQSNGDAEITWITVISHC